METRRTPVPEPVCSLLYGMAHWLEDVRDGRTPGPIAQFEAARLIDEAHALHVQPASDDTVIIAVSRSTAERWRGVLRASREVRLRGAVYAPGSVHNAASRDAETATHEVACALARAVGDDPFAPEPVEATPDPWAEQRARELEAEARALRIERDVLGWPRAVEAAE